MALGVMTVSQAAERLGVGVARIHQFIMEGRIKAEKTGSVWLLSDEEVERFQSVPRPNGRPPEKIFSA